MHLPSLRCSMFSSSESVICLLVHDGRLWVEDII